MKIAVTGKGGVGNTTLSASLSLLYSNEGYKVLAIDADPDANLASGLGISDTSSIVPIAEMKGLIYERTKAGGGGFFKLNPRVDYIPEKFSLKEGNLPPPPPPPPPPSTPRPVDVSARKIPCSEPWSSI